MRIGPTYHLAALAAVCIIAGCTRPAVEAKQPGFQPSEDSLRDWNVVAQQVAAQMTQRGLLADPTLPQPQTAPPVPSLYYINVIAPGSTFLHEVRQALQGEIIRRGGVVARSPVGAVVVNLDIDVVAWGVPQRGTGGLGTLVGLATGTGILLANDGRLSPAAGFGIAAGAGIAADVIGSMAPMTNVEGMWEATILKDDQVVMDARAPIYINPNDVALYGSRTRFSPMTSFQPIVATAAVRLRYDP